MRLCWLTVLTTVLLFSIESSAIAQLIPRRNTTRPCPRYNIPPGEYNVVSGRSRSVVLISDRFVYFDNPFGQTLEEISDTIAVTSENASTNGGPASSSVLATENSKKTPGTVNDDVTNKTPDIGIKPENKPVVVQRDKKLFQWRQDRIQIDHCEISKMAVQLFRNGDWVLNLRADQNRKVAGNRFNPTLYIKRNRFGILLRCYGNMANSPAELGLTTGKPVLAEIVVEEFWVQNRIPNFLVVSENDQAIKDRFDSIDRVEIEFFYYQ